MPAAWTLVVLFGLVVVLALVAFVVGLFAGVVAGGDVFVLRAGTVVALRMLLLAVGDVAVAVATVALVPKAAVPAAEEAGGSEEAAAGAEPPASVNWLE